MLLSNEQILQRTQPWFRRAHPSQNYAGMQIFKTDVMVGDFAQKYHEHTLMIAKSLIFSESWEETPPRRMLGYEKHFRRLPPEVDDEKCSIVYLMDRFYKLVRVEEDMYGHTMFFIVSELKLDFGE